MPSKLIRKNPDKNIADYAAPFPRRRPGRSPCRSLVFSQALDGELHHHGADRSHRHGRKEKDRDRDEKQSRGPPKECVAVERQVHAGPGDRMAENRLGVTENRSRDGAWRRLEEQDRERHDRGSEEKPARVLLVLHMVGDLASQEVAKAQAAEQHADHARPAVCSSPGAGSRAFRHHLGAMKARPPANEDREVDEARLDGPCPPNGSSGSVGPVGIRLPEPRARTPRGRWPVGGRKGQKLTRVEPRGIEPIFSDSTSGETAPGRARALREDPG